jgi:hypothetical protein
MSDLGIRFSHKETRQLAEEANEAGFVYVDDDAKGHALLLHPSGVKLSLSETPGHGQIKRVRATIAKATGTRRGSTKRKERAAILRAELAKNKAARDALMAEHNQRIEDAAWEREAWRKINARRKELRNLETLMRTEPGTGRIRGRSILY